MKVPSLDFSDPVLLTTLFVGVGLSFPLLYVLTSQCCLGRGVRDVAFESTSLIPFRAKQARTALPRDLHVSTAFFARFHWPRISTEDALRRADAWFEFLNGRRSVRFFDKDAVPPLELIERCVMTAGTAPSGAHLQPWHFVIVRDAETKQKIRELVEEEEFKNYKSRMGHEWKEDVMKVVGNLHSAHPRDVGKPYLTDAPYLIVVMKENYQMVPKKSVLDTIPEDPHSEEIQVHEVSGEEVEMERRNNWYPTESVGIATGMLFAALHNANLATLPSTPMGAEQGIRKLCHRPKSEKVFLLMPVGYPSRDCTVPFRTAQDWRKPPVETYSVL